MDGILRWACAALVACGCKAPVPAAAPEQDAPDERSSGRDSDTAYDIRSTVRVADLPTMSEAGAEAEDLVISPLEWGAQPNGRWVRIWGPRAGIGILEIETPNGWRGAKNGVVVMCGKHARGASARPRSLRWTVLRGHGGGLFVSRAEGTFDPVECAVRTDARMSVAAMAVLPNRSIFAFRAAGRDGSDELVLVLPATSKLAADGLRDGDIVTGAASIVTLPVRETMACSVVAELSLDDVRSFRSETGLMDRRRQPERPATLVNLELVQAASDPEPLLFVSTRSAEGLEFPDVAPVEAASPVPPEPRMLPGLRDARGNRLGRRP